MTEIDTNDSTHSKRNLIFYLLLATVLLLISLMLGLTTSLEISGDTLEQFKQTLEPLMSLSPIALLFIIFFNNAIKILGAIVLGIMLGFPPLIFVTFNGYIVGLIISALKSATSYGVIIASLAPHGIIEMPILVLATALGLTIGAESLKYVTRRKSQVRVQLRQGIKIYLKWILISLFIAAIIEVFITPQIILLVGGSDLLTQ